MNTITYAEVQDALQKAKDAKQQADDAVNRLNDLLQTSSTAENFVKADEVQTSDYNLYLEADGWVRITDKNGYDTNGINYKGLHASGLHLENKTGGTQGDIFIDENDKNRLKLEIGDYAIWIDPGGNMYFRVKGENIYSFYSSGTIGTPKGSIQPGLADRVQAGYELINIPSGGTVTSQRIDFPKTFDKEPKVVATPGTSVPNKVSPVAVHDISTTGFTAELERTNSTNTYIQWIATSL